MIENKIFLKNILDFAENHNFDLQIKYNKNHCEVEIGEALKKDYFYSSDRRSKDLKITWSLIEKDYKNFLKKNPNILKAKYLEIRKENK